MANFLADLNYELPEDLRATKTLRIVEFDVEAETDGNNKSVVDVRLWDTSGDDMQNYYWAVYREMAHGIVFVYNAENDFETRKLDLLYSYFVNSKGFDHRACLLCCYIGEGGANYNTVKLSERNRNRFWYFNICNGDFRQQLFENIGSQS